jgi:hypothetical protein
MFEIFQPHSQEDNLVSSCLPFLALNLTAKAAKLYQQDLQIAS